MRVHSTFAARLLVLVFSTFFLLAPLISSAEGISALFHIATPSQSSMPCHDESPSSTQCCCHGHSDGHACQCNNGHCFGSGASLILTLSAHEVESGKDATPHQIISMPSTLSPPVTLRPPIIRL